MQRQPGAVAARPGINAEKFKERLQKLKDGVRFVWMLNTKDITGLKVLDETTPAKILQRQLDMPVGKGVPVKIVEKIIPLKFEMDLTGAMPDRLIVCNMPNWSPNPLDFEQIEGPPGGQHRTDVIMFRGLQVLKYRNEAPFGVDFYSNIHQHITRLIQTISQKTRQKTAKYPILEPGIDADFGAAVGLQPDVQDWRPFSAAEGLTTRDIPLLKPDMSSALYYSSNPDNLRVGLYPVTLRHPITQAKTQYYAMSYSHLVFQEVKLNWLEWKVQISPWDSERTKLDRDYMVLMEKDLVEEIIKWCKEELPCQTGVIPSNKMSFAIGRHYQKQRNASDQPAGVLWDWRTSKNSKVPTSELYKKFICEVEVKLTFGLLPMQLSRDSPLLLTSLVRKDGRGGSVKDEVGFDNRKLLQDSLETEANTELQIEQVPFDYMKLDARSDDEDQALVEDPPVEAELSSMVVRPRTNDADVPPEDRMHD